MGGGGLQDPGGVSGHVVGGAEVDLLGDNGGGLVDGGHSLGLGLGDRGGGGSGGHVVHGVGDDGSGSVVLRAIGGHSGGGLRLVTQSGHGGSCHGVVGRGAVGTSQDKSKCRL